MTRLLARRLRAVAVVSALALVATDSGCEQKRTSVPPLIPQRQHPADTKLGKLELIIERLNAQLDSAQAAVGSGVESQRTCTYRVLPEDENKAEVTITTRAQLSLADAQAEEELDESAGKGAAPKGKDADEAEPAAKKQTAESVRPVQKNEVVVLVYEGDRWKLLEQPKGQTEQLLFEYALSTSDSAP